MSIFHIDAAVSGIAAAYSDIIADNEDSDYDAASAFYDMGLALLSGSDAVRLQGTTLPYYKETN